MTRETVDLYYHRTTGPTFLPSERADHYVVTLPRGWRYRVDFRKDHLEMGSLVVLPRSVASIPGAKVVTCRRYQR